PVPAGRRISARRQALRRRHQLRGCVVRRRRDAIALARRPRTRVGGVSTTILLLAFAAGAAATWVAGLYLSRSTDALDDRLRLGEAIGGLVFLAIAGSLPEAAITVSAALAGNLGLAFGNLIGGIATQTLVLVLCDAVS